MNATRRTWIGSGGSIYEAAGTPLPTALSAGRTALADLLERTLRGRDRSPQPLRRRPPAPEPDPAAALEAALRRTVEGRRLGGATGEALDLEARALAVDLLRDRLAALERQLAAALGCPPTYRRERAVYTLRVEIPAARRELAAAQHVLGRLVAEQALVQQARARRPAA